MRTTGVKKISENAYFVVDTLAFGNQITRFDVALASQTIVAAEGPRTDGPDDEEDLWNERGEAPPAGGRPGVV